MPPDGAAIQPDWDSLKVQQFQQLQLGPGGASGGPAFHHLWCCRGGRTGDVAGEGTALGPCNPRDDGTEGVGDSAFTPRQMLYGAGWGSYLSPPKHGFAKTEG